MDGERPRIGFIGLGFMGEPMAANVLRAGFELHVWNRTAAKAASLVSRGARLVERPAELAASCDIVLSCLASVRASREILLEGGDCGPSLRSVSREGQVFVDHGTVDLAASRDCAAAFEQFGASFLDAPVSGGPLGARDATLSIMVGGPAPTFESARPALEAMGANVVHMGPTGSGTATKLANQLLVGAHTLASCEALLLASRAGVDLEKLQAVLSKSWGQSRMLERNGPVIAARDFQRSGSPLRNLLKDLEIVAALGETVGLPLPVTNVARHIYRELSREGAGESDITAACQWLESARGGE